MVEKARRNAAAVGVTNAEFRSRTLYSDDRLKAVLFGFARGEELSEHTASTRAGLHFLQGEAKLTIEVTSRGGRSARCGASATACRAPASGRLWSGGRRRKG